MRPPFSQILPQLSPVYSISPIFLPPVFEKKKKNWEYVHLRHPSRCISCIVNSSQSVTRSLLMFPLPPSLFSQLFVIVCTTLCVSDCVCVCARAHSCACVFVSIMPSLFCFSSASEKQKLIKYGTRWSSISLNHHVIKMASLGDQLKRSRRTMSSPSDIYGPGYVNMLPLFSMYISCNYHFL